MSLSSRSVRRLAAASLLAGVACRGTTDPEPSILPVPPDPLYDSAPSWSPDGQTIAFVRTGRAVADSTALRLRPSGASIDVTAAHVADLRTARSPFVTAPVATSYLPPPSGLMVVSATGGAPRAVTAEVGAPAWLPDGRAVLAIRRYDGRLVRVAVDGGEAPRFAADVGAWVMSPAVSPSGAVAVVSDRTDDGRRGGRLRIQLLGGDGRLRALPGSAGDGSQMAPTWGPEGRLAYETWLPSTGGGSVGVFVRDTLGGAPARVADGAAPAWSPTGEWIAYLQTPPGRAESTLRLVRPDGTGDRLLVPGTPDNFVQGRPTWSPDGRSLAVVRSVREPVGGWRSARTTGVDWDTAVWAVDVATGALRRVTAPHGGR